MSIRSTVFSMCTAAAIAAPAADAQCLPTLFAANNGGSLGGAVYFDITVSNPAGITVREFDTNTAEMVSFTFDVYIAPMTSVGNETSQAAWTLASSGSGTGQGRNNRARVDVTDFMLAPGSYGMALVMGPTAGHDYTNGNGGNQRYTNSDISLSFGTASNVPWTPTIFNPRVWNGVIFYTTAGGLPCATASSFGQGCVGASPLTLTPVGTPAVGSTMLLRTTNVPTGSPAGVLMLGLFEFMPPLSLNGLGAPGCFQYTTPDATVLWIPSGTTASTNIGIPNNPGLAGLVVVSQSVSLTPGINMLGVTTSNGVRLTVGS